MKNEDHATAPKIGKFFRSARNEKKLTVRQVGLMSGISYSHVSRFENGVHAIPSLKRLAALADALEINLEDVFKQLDQE